MEYVSHVLPTLGEESVEQRAVAELVDGLDVTASDAPAIARLKGDARLADVIARAAELASTPQPEELVARLEGEYVRVREREVAALLEEVRDELGLTAQARERFRMNVLRRFYEDYGDAPRRSRLARLRRGRACAAVEGLPRQVARPRLAVVAPERLVRSLLTSRARLEEAADGILDAAEQRLLLRPRAGFGWSDADVALVDEAHALVAEPPRLFGHVIVDEAQDLTPMQLRMVARRAARGSLTILGDIAQATGPVVYRGWDELLERLPARRGRRGRGAPPCLPRARRRSWPSRCRCSSRSRRTSRRRWPSGPAAHRRGSSGWRPASWSRGRSRSRSSSRGRTASSR